MSGASERGEAPGRAARGVLRTSDRIVVRVVAAAATLAAAASVAVLAWAGGVGGVLSWFSLWVLAPPLLCGALAIFTPETLGTWPRLALVVLALALGPCAYVSTWLAPPDAQSALIFVFMPLWQLVALSAVILWGIVVEAWRTTRRAQDA